METWQQVWRLIIDTFSALAWPAVAVIALFVLRQPLSGLVNRIRGGEFLGAKFQTDAAETANAALAAADEFNEDAAAAAAEPTAEPAYSRAQVESFVRSAATAGYEIGNMRIFGHEVEPAISWEEGAPRIDYWRSSAAGSSTRTILNRDRKALQEIEVVRGLDDSRRVYNTLADKSLQRALQDRRRAAENDTPPH